MILAQNEINNITNSIDTTKPLSFYPNIRFEKSTSKSGYIWGKPFSESNIIYLLKKLEESNQEIFDFQEFINILGLHPDSIVAERWIISDDFQGGSCICVDGDQVSFSSVLKKKAHEILGSRHVEIFGPCLGVVMKQIDTHKDPLKGSLSVQVHPAAGYDKAPAKPEVWIGRGKIYLGWKQKVSKPEIKKAIKDATLESFLREWELSQNSIAIVPGGQVHAIRFDTFTYEWSKSVVLDEGEKTTLQSATFALYDSTDGKIARPGKENVEGALDVISHASGFDETFDFYKKPRLIESDSGDNQVYSLVQLPQFFIQKILIKSSYLVSLEKRGMAFYVEKGQVNILNIQKELIGSFTQGQEFFLPHAMKGCYFERDSKWQEAVIYSWFTPFPEEIN